MENINLRHELVKLKVNVQNVKLYKQSPDFYANAYSSTFVLQ